MSRPYADQIGAFDVDGVEYEPIDVCIDCGAEIVIGYLRCTACEAEHERKEDFDANVTHATEDTRR